MTASGFTRRHALRLIVGATAGTVVLGKVSSVAIAQTTAANQTVNTDLLNVRSGAGLSFDIVETLPLGSEVTPDAAQRKAADGINWIFVTVVASGNEGWADSGFLGVADSEASGTPEAGVAAAATTSKWVSVADANLRDGAGLTFGVITTLAIGQEATVTGDSTDADGYTWFPVTVSDESGWLADIVLADEKPASQGFEQGAAVTVNTDLLNLREEPGVSTGIVGTYAFGIAGIVVSATPIAADDVTWHQVELDEDGAIGWFAEQYLSAGASTGGPRSSAVKISDGPVNLRANPVLTGEILGTVETGSTATLITSNFTAGDGYQWINVRLDDQTGREGWIASEFVTFV